jgi:transmembrane sensor
LKQGKGNRGANAVHRRASEWLVLLDSGDATADDRKRFEAWLRESPRHRTALDELEETWGRLTAMGDRARVDGNVEPDPDAVLKHLDHIGWARRRPRAAAWAAAAAVVVAAALSALLILPGESQTPYRTDVGERRTVSLPDGSTVDLNTSTELLVEYTDQQRLIAMLRGEVFFDVARDESRPFIVAAGHGAIRAVGTGFAVRLRSPDLVSVTVTEGIVQVTRSSVDRSDAPQTTGTPPAPTVRPGQRAEYNREDTRIEAVAQDELERAQAWRRGLLVFEDASLAEVIDEVNRYTETRLVLADAELGELRLGGTFRTGRVEALLNVLEKGFGIRVTRDDPHTVTLRASPDTSPRDPS